MQNNDNKLSVLRFQLRKIVDASDSTIEMMQRKPISSLRVIMRNARDIKDANPLQSMLTTQSGSYPITISRTGASKYNIPEEYLRVSKRKTLVSDNYLTDRIMAKTNVIDWWIKNSELPNNESIKVIDALRRYHRKEVALYNSIEWRNSKIRLGPVVMDRERHKTRMASTSLSKAVKDTALQQILAPSHFIPRIQVPEEVINQLKELIEIGVETKMMLATQIRILSNHLNPRTRYIPTIPGGNNAVNLLRHAINQPMWSLTNYKISLPKESDLIDQEVRNLCTVFLKCIRESEGQSEKEQLMSCIKKATVIGVPIRECLSGLNRGSKGSVQLVKCVLGLPITFEYKLYDVWFSPDESNTRAIEMTLRRNLTYMKYYGVEKVYIQYMNTKGYFIHSSGNVTRMCLSTPDSRETFHIIGAVAVYTRFRISIARGDTLQEVYEWVFNKYKKNPWEMFNMKERPFVNMLNKGLSHEILRFDSEAVYHARTSKTCRVSEDMNLYEPSTSKVVPVPNEREFQYIQDGVRFPYCSMDDYREPKKRLLYKTKWYLSNYPKLKEHIDRGNYNWKNQSITNVNNSVEAASFAATARYIISRLHESAEAVPGVIPQICFCYCFSGIAMSASLNFDLSSILKISWVEGVVTDLGGSEGVFIINEEGTFLFGERISGIPNEQRLGFLDGVLPGFAIVELKGQIPLIKSAQWLMDNKDELEDGAKFRVLIGGRFMMAVRDMRIESQMINTIERQVKVRTEGILKRSLEMARVHAKRRRD